MKTPVRVICRHETALGIALTGVEPIEVDELPDSERGMRGFGSSAF